MTEHSYRFSLRNFKRYLIERTEITVPFLSFECSDSRLFQRSSMFELELFYDLVHHNGGQFNINPRLIRDSGQSDPPDDGTRIVLRTA